MTHTQKAVEAAARAIYDKCGDYPNLRQEVKLFVAADLARSALNAALAVDGVCLVPSKPIGYFFSLNDGDGFHQVHVDYESDPDVYPFYADQKAHDDLAKEKIAAANDGEERR